MENRKRPKISMPSDGRRDLVLAMPNKETNDKRLPVAYRSVSDHVQNEIDRLSLASLRGSQLNRKPQGEHEVNRSRIFGRRNEDRQSILAAEDIDVAQEATNDDHLVPLDVLERRYETSMQMGLSEEQVAIRRARDGQNILSPPKTLPAWLQFAKCLLGGFCIILWIAFVLCILAYKPLGDPPDIYNVILGLVILVVIFSQAIFFYIQENRSSNLMASFANLLPTFCQVTRDGRLKTVEASELVVGDIVRIKAGDKIPADIRLFQVNQAKIEKSSLTGESEPILLSVTSADPNLYETRNLALFGTSILEGTGAGIVINTADRTIMGKIARVASNTDSVTTSLQKEINYFTGIIAFMAAIVCVIVIAGYYGGVAPSHPGLLTTSDVVTDCIAVVVALLPEGMPMALALILTMIAKRMYTAKILVKKLTVLETLGSATLIASDKTGTLTQNRMALNHAWINNDHPITFQIPDDNSSIEKHYDVMERSLPGCFGLKNIGKHLSEPALTYLCQIMCLCNKTQFENDATRTPQFRRKNSARKFVGNPTEGALLNAADEYLDVDNIRQSAPIVKEIAFSSRTKYHLTVHKILDAQIFQNSAFAIRSNIDQCAYLIFLKGAPEYVLGMCTKSVVNGREIDIDQALIEKITRANETMASHGERVLAFAYRKLDNRDYPVDFQFNTDHEDQWTKDLCFLGLAGIIDPPREGVADSINECHNAHVRVMMITGDHPTTAVAIARAVNIITKNHVKSMDDVHRDVAISVDDTGEVSSKWLIKVKNFIRPPPERQFMDESIVVTGRDLGQLNEKQWDFVLRHREVVFARTTPQQKLQIVKECRQRGDVVAVTGDGVNDAPALKAADLGVAMGICGSDITKEAANMILLDDNFVTIVKGIKEGRLLFNNLKKVVCYLLPSGSFSEILPVFAAVFLGMPIPLSTFLMIVICMGSDMIGSIGMIHEYAESDIMHRPPRDARKDRLMNFRTIFFAYFFIGIMQSSIAFFMYFFTMWKVGGVMPEKIVFSFQNWATDGWIPHMTPEQQIDLNCYGQSAYFVSLVMTQLWNILAVRTRRQSIFTQKFNTKLFYYMLAEVAVVLATCYLPVLQIYTYTKPMEYYNFLMPLAMGSIILVLDEIRKLIVRKFPTSPIAQLAW